MSGRDSQSQVAQSIPFDKDGTSFTADNLQDAIVEAKATATGLSDILINDDFILLLNNSFELIVKG